ncbi:MAG: hypothetical protein C4555_00650 [Dehalococcoidia bacterium]|nr:MAG: hypothetical protein C4555_00650 [Dehalococcoidia bacterium]
MKKLWQPGLFVILNLVFIGWLGAVIEMLFRVLNGEDPLALLGILFADIAFLIIGVVLIILKRHYRIPALNWMLPFIAILGLTIVAFLNVSTGSIWAGIVVSGVLIVSSIVTTVAGLRK